MEYFFKPSAVRDLKKLSLGVRRIIFKKLSFYFKSDNPLKFAEVLKDKTLGEFRFRVGDYRVIFDVASNKAIILKIGHRKNVYK